MSKDFRLEVVELLKKSMDNIDAAGPNFCFADYITDCGLKIVDEQDLETIINAFTEVMLLSLHKDLHNAGPMVLSILVMGAMMAKKGLL